MLEAFATALRDHLENLPLAAEILFVDDGSSDGTWSLLCQLQQRMPGVILIRLTRNFGKEAAILAGLERCSGDAAIVMDADLQHPPSLLAQMTEAWLAGGVDIVDGVKSGSGHSGGMAGFTSRLFNSAFARMTGFSMTGASDYKLLDRRVIDSLLSLGDYNLFFRGATLWMGFSHRQIEFDVVERSDGDTKWSLMSRLALAITAITSFTSVPLHLMTLVGLLSFAFAFLLGLQTLYMWVNGQAVEGFTTVIILLLFFGSMITLGLGIIGAYLSKIHDEVRAGLATLSILSNRPPGRAETVTDDGQDRALRTVIFRYAVVGGINTAVHFLVTVVLVESGLMSPVPASVAGFICALLVAYMLNRHWTFGQTDRPLERLYRFSAVSLLGLGLNTLIMYLAVDWLNWHYLIGLLLVAVVIPPLNFLLNLYWSFRPG